MIKDYAGRSVPEVAPTSRANGASVPSYQPPASATADSVTVHKAFRGDRSLYAGPGRGIDAVPEYRRR